MDIPGMLGIAGCCAVAMRLESSGRAARVRRRLRQKMRGIRGVTTFLLREGEDGVPVLEHTRVLADAGRL
jgi:hypothetical protein